MAQGETGRKPRQAGGCTICGICCDLYGDKLLVVPGDLRRWRAAGRLDILRWVGPDGELWRDPQDGTRLEACPFLARSGPERARCGIHATKPAICRDYPRAIHGRRCVLRGGGRGSL